MKNNSDSETIKDLNRRKKISRDYLRSLSPLEKIEKLVTLQEQYYETLSIREKNSGRPIPEKWQKWCKARYEKSDAQ